MTNTKSVPLTPPVPMPDRNNSVVCPVCHHNLGIPEGDETTCDNCEVTLVAN